MTLAEPLPIELDEEKPLDARFSIIEDFLKAFRKEEVDGFALHLLGDGWNEKLKTAEWDLLNLRQINADLDNTNADLVGRLEKEKAISKGIAEKLAVATGDLSMERARMRELQRSYDRARAAADQAEALTANLKVASPDLEALADYIRGIRPDPRCTVSGCYGKRGYNGFAVTIDKEGHRKVTVNLCCGKIGESEYAMLGKKLNDQSAQLSEMDRMMRMLFIQADDSKRWFADRTIVGRTRRGWEWLMKKWRVK
jgi:hypothetical protein